jgi:DNA-binding MarR family transcriptional regulator
MVAPVSSVSPFDAVVRIFHAQGSLRREIDRELGEAHGISLDDLMILLHLEAASGRMRRSELAEHMRESTLAVTRALGPLERIGLLDRRADLRRSPRHLRGATTAGFQMAIDARATAEEISRWWFRRGAPARGWSAEELRQLADLLARLGGEGLPLPDGD